HNPSPQKGEQQKFSISKNVKRSIMTHLTIRSSFCKKFVRALYGLKYLHIEQRAKLQKHNENIGMVNNDPIPIKTSITRKNYKSTMKILEWSIEHYKQKPQKHNKNIGTVNNDPIPIRSSIMSKNYKSTIKILEWSIMTPSQLNRALRAKTTKAQ
ncbi:18911_t:CDS:2, partial [Dentiscutata erythropus]